MTLNSFKSLDKLIEIADKDLDGLVSRLVNANYEVESPFENYCIMTLDEIKGKEISLTVGTGRATTSVSEELAKKLKVGSKLWFFKNKVLNRYISPVGFGDFVHACPELLMGDLGGNKDSIEQFYQETVNEIFESPAEYNTDHFVYSRTFFKSCKDVIPKPTLKEAMLFEVVGLSLAGLSLYCQTVSRHIEWISPGFELDPVLYRSLLLDAANMMQSAPSAATVLSSYKSLGSTEPNYKNQLINNPSGFH